MTALWLKISLLLVAISFLSVGQNSEPRTQDSGVYTANKTGHNTNHNVCSDSEAKCVYLSVSIPLGSQITSIHCYANIDINAGPDLAHGELSEVPCGKDQSWSMFSRPVTQTSENAVTVSSTFYNRSSDRDRDVKLVVDFRK